MLTYRSKASIYNESSLNEVDSCVCDAGYYRHPVLDRPDSSCTSKFIFLIGLKHIS